MKKRILCLALVMVMIFTLLPMSAFAADVVSSGKCGSNLTWTLDSEGTLTISGTGAMTDYSYDSNAPWFNSRSSIKRAIIENGVTSIGDYAFCGCGSLTNVAIPDSVTTIGESAFEYCSSLTNVTIPDSVTTIGDYAFEYCSSLTSVTIGSGVTSIGDYAFSYCSSLTSVTIPNSVTTIGDYAFHSCSLTSVTIPDSVTSIGSSAFSGCSSLTSVTIPDSVTSIGEAAFNRCSNLTSVTIGSGVTTIGDYAFTDCKSLTNVAIPDSVTSIGGGAFSNCDSLTNVAIGSGVTSIGEYAFYCCSSLTSVTIGSGVASIGEYAFEYCSSLTDVYYGGSEEQWNQISIGILNENLTEANIHFKTDTPISNPFTDVSESSIYYNAILWAYYHEPQQITGGYTATEFRPGNPCTRGQVVTFLWRAAGCPEPTGDTSMFNDASSIASPYQKAVAWAVEKGITTGYNDGTFRPNDSVTRAQFVTFLWRYEGKPATSGSIAGFTDASSIAEPYQQAVAWAVEKGITTGYNDGSFRPNDTCTRWAVVLFMYRDME